MSEMSPTDDPREYLTDSECEQLLAGQELPGSAAGAVFRVLNSSIPADAGGALPGEGAAMAAFRTQRGAGRAHHRFTARIAAVGITGGIVLAGGVAAAATGHFGAITHAFTSHSSHHPTTPTPTPPAPAATNGPAAPGTPGAASSGKAHAGHGKGHGVGETAKPTHPTHPAHPSHPVHPSNSPSGAHNGGSNGHNTGAGSRNGATQGKHNGAGNDNTSHPSAGPKSPTPRAKAATPQPAHTHAATPRGLVNIPHSSRAANRTS